MSTPPAKRAKVTPISWTPVELKLSPTSEDLCAVTGHCAGCLAPLSERWALGHDLFTTCKCGPAALSCGPCTQDLIKHQVATGRCCKQIEDCQEGDWDYADEDCHWFKMLKQVKYICPCGATMDADEMRRHGRTCPEFPVPADGRLKIDCCCPDVSVAESKSFPKCSHCDGRMCPRCNIPCTVETCMMIPRPTADGLKCLPLTDKEAYDWSIESESFPDDWRWTMKWDKMTASAALHIWWAINKQRMVSAELKKIGIIHEAADEGSTTQSLCSRKNCTRCRTINGPAELTRLHPDCVLHFIHAAERLWNKELPVRINFSGNNPAVVSALADTPTPCQVVITPTPTMVEVRLEYGFATVPLDAYLSLSVKLYELGEESSRRSLGKFTNNVVEPSASMPLELVRFKFDNLSRSESTRYEIYISGLVRCIPDGVRLGWYS